MSCNDVLIRMLDADPEELSINGRSALSRHLRGCPQCHAVARRLVADTAMIARVAGAMERADFTTIVTAQRPHRRIVAGAVAASLAAGLLTLVALQQSVRTPSAFAAATVAPSPALLAAPPSGIAAVGGILTGLATAAQRVPARGGPGRELALDLESFAVSPFEPVRFVVRAPPSEPALTVRIAADSLPRVTVAADANATPLRSRERAVSVIWIN